MSNKVIKFLRQDFLLLSILEVFIVVYYLSKGNFSFQNIIFLAILVVGYFGARKEKKYAGIIGMVVGTLMILTILAGDVIDFLLGIFLVMHSVKYNKIIK